jgi:membrane peptidoglycan carboxypeptidase
MDKIPPKDPSKKALVVAMVEPGTGNIQAMTQNTDWGTKKEPGTSAFNLAVSAEDGGGQGAAAGSTFKVFTLLAALEKGISPFTIIDSPPRKEFTGFVDCDGRLMTDGGTKPYIVSNSTSSGRFDMFRAAAYSVNTFFVELEKRAGVCETVDVARRLGIKHATGQELGEVFNDGITAEVASFTLGSTEVTPLMMANAYATVSAHGVY